MTDSTGTSGWNPLARLEAAYRSAREGIVNFFGFGQRQVAASPRWQSAGVSGAHQLADVDGMKPDDVTDPNRIAREQERDREIARGAVDLGATMIASAVFEGAVVRGTRLLTAAWDAAEFAPGQLRSHFLKHAREWGEGNITEAAYLKRARNLLGSDPGGEILGFTRANGDVVRYNVRTNEFAVGTSDGKIRTLFRPKDGIQYWYDQIGGAD